MSVNLLTERDVSNRSAACLPGVSEGCEHYHRRRRTAGATDVITTNKGVEALHESLASDEIPATAILDRLLHHATTLNIRGEGFRLKEKRKAGLTIQPPGKSEEKGDDRATSGGLVSQLEIVENRTSQTGDKGTSLDRRLHWQMAPDHHARLWQGLGVQTRSLSAYEEVAT